MAVFRSLRAVELATKRLDAETWPDFARLARTTTGSGLAAGASTSTRRARRPRGELPGGHRRPAGLGLLPAQRHRDDVRAPRIRARPADRQAPLGGEPARRLSLGRVLV